MITGYVIKRSETDYVINCDAQGNGGFDVVTDNFSVAEGDLIQLYGKSDVSGKEGSLKEFRIMTLRGFIV